MFSNHAWLDHSFIRFLRNINHILVTQIGKFSFFSLIDCYRFFFGSAFLIFHSFLSEIHDFDDALHGAHKRPLSRAKKSVIFFIQCLSLAAAGRHIVHRFIHIKSMMNCVIKSCFLIGVCSALTQRQLAYNYGGFGG